MAADTKQHEFITTLNKQHWSLAVDTLFLKIKFKKTKTSNFWILKRIWRNERNTKLSSSCGPLAPPGTVGVAHRSGREFGCREDTTPKLLPLTRPRAKNRTSSRVSSRHKNVVTSELQGWGWGACFETSHLLKCIFVSVTFEKHTLCLQGKKQNPNKLYFIWSIC